MKMSKEDIYRKDIITVLEDVGFHEIAEQGLVGYVIPFHSNNDIEVYLKKGYLKIHLTPAFINLEIYKADRFTYIQHRGRSEVIPSSWYYMKLMKLKKDSENCMSEFRDFLLLSICRDSFLSPEEEGVSIYRRKERWNMDYDFDYDWWFV